MAKWSLRQHWQAEGGGSELLRLAFPLILSTSVWTLQVTIDRVLLSWLSSDAVSAAMVASLIFWTPLSLLYNTAGYAATFVAQYVGAGRPHRVGPAVWQAIHFSMLAGLAFLALIPLGGPLLELGNQPSAVRGLADVYFRCLCFSALPTMVTAAVSGFFAGRGDSWTVLLLSAAGMVVNAVLDYAWIFGRWGFPEWGIAGAGWATVTGMSVSALLGLGLMLRASHRAEFRTLAGWRPERELFRRLMRYGLPSGLQWMIDGLAFTAFMLLVGWLGAAELAATSIAFTINMVAFLPMLGMGQAVCVLVGQRLGEDRPDLAERTTWSGMGLAWLYMTAVALLYLAAPGAFLFFFQNDREPDQWPRVAELVPVLLRFVAVYSLLDSINLVLSFALRGAGDTRFVTLVALTLSWPIMVLPTVAAWYFGWGLYAAWTFASAYIMMQALVFLVRFRQGKWKSMRVIEAVPVADAPGEQPLSTGRFPPAARQTGTSSGHVPAPGLMDGTG
ncbi:MAG TPA: MATE family efflux transporter [Gemmataceae bacterium]|nr:MATE family efflux transporter [Gemmataceae bacterium]